MSEFKREDRYIIIKRSDLKKVPVAYRSALVDPMFSLLSHLPRREFVVVEHDWPEYQLVWAMIEHRMAGKPVPDFNLWRRADALQALLTAADERADSFDRLYTSSLDERDQLQQRADVLEGLLRNQVELLSAMFSSFDDKAYWLPVIVEECKKLSAALKPAERGGDKAMSFAQIAQFNDDNDHCPEREE